VELQLFDGERIIFRAYPQERVYALLEEGDIDVGALRERVETTLRGLRPGAVGDTGYQHRDLDVLGEHVTVDVRNPANRELIRTAELEAAIRSVAGPLQALAVAPLDPPTHRLATLLQSAPDGVPAAELQERLLAHIEAITAAIDSEEVQAGLHRQARELEDARVVFGLVSALRDRGLAEEADGVVRPTAKLRAIRL
jgi:hypothetical protein